MKFKTKPEVVEAITFDELVNHGLKQVAATASGMPWSFKYNGEPVTHENDGCYLIGSLAWKMTRNHMLITDAQGQVYPMALQTFEKKFEPVS